MKMILSLFQDLELFEVVSINIYGLSSSFLLI